MPIEYEVKFLNIDKDNIRKKLKKIGAELIRSEYLQKRFVLNPPNKKEDERVWLRVRDEGNKTTMALKRITTVKTINGQEETEMEVSNFETAIKLLTLIGCKKKAYQENKRELWMFNDVEITIDEWPFINPFIEIEGNNEKDVKEVTKKMGFDYSKGIFGSVAVLYRDKFNVSLKEINNNTKKVVFGGENPFLN